MPKLLALVLSLVGIAATVQAKPTPVVNSMGVVLLPDPLPLQTLGRSQLPLITDMYWLRAINFGTTVRTAIEGRAMLGMGKLIAQLDKNFRQIYWFSALNALVPASETKWANAEEAAEFLEEGRKQFPNDVFMSIALAFNYMTYQRDFMKAASVLETAARIPNAPTYLGPLATRLLAAAGQADKSRELTRQFIEEATDDDTRNFFLDRLKAIDLEEILVTVDKAAVQFKLDNGKEISNINDLYSSGQLSKYSLVDPFGGTIEWSPDGGAYSTSHPERLKLHE